MAAEYQPVRLVSKDGETVIVARDPQSESDLRFASGYRTAEDQSNLEATGPKLDNGKLVEAGDEAPVVSDGTVVADDAPAEEAAPSKPAGKPSAPKTTGTPSAGDASK